MVFTTVSVGDVLLLSHVASRQSFQLLVNSSRTSTEHSARNALLGLSHGLDLLVERLESVSDLTEDDEQTIVEGTNSIIKHAGAVLDVTGLWMWRRHNVVEREASVVNAIGIILVGIVDVVLEVLQKTVTGLEESAIPDLTFPPYGTGHGAASGRAMAEPEEILSILKKLKVRLEKCATPARYSMTESAKSSEFALTGDTSSIQDPPPFSIVQRADSDGNITTITDSPILQDDDATSIAISEFSTRTGQGSRGYPFNETPLLSQEDWDSDGSESLSPQENEQLSDSNVSESIASSRPSADDASVYSHDPDPHRHCQFCTTLRPTESSIDISTLDLNDAASILERISVDSCCEDAAAARIEAAAKLGDDNESLRKGIFKSAPNRGAGPRHRFSVASGLAEITPDSRFKRYSIASASSDSLSIKSGRKSVRFSTDESQFGTNSASAATKSSQTSFSSHDLEPERSNVKFIGSRSKILNRNKPLPAVSPDPGRPMAVLLEDEPRQTSRQDSYSEIKSHRKSVSSTISAEQRMLFETEVMRRSELICSVEGTTVSYARMGAAGDYETTPAMSKCRILLVETIPRDEDDLPVKSIWAFSEDQSVRMEQRLPAGADIIPYNAWGSNCKILIKVPSVLRFHGHKYREHALDEVQAGWVTYEVDDEDQSDELQGAFLSKQLLLTVKTMKTSRTFDGLAATFSVQERICGLENLRLWRDNDSNGVHLMIHYMPSFQSGFLRFYVNSRSSPIVIAADNDRGVKITGLSVSLQLPEETKSSKSSIKSSKSSKSKAKKSELKKLLTGIKIEFSSVEDKKAFLHVVNEAKMLPFSE